MKVEPQVWAEGESYGDFSSAFLHLLRGVDNFKDTWAIIILNSDTERLSLTNGGFDWAEGTKETNKNSMARKDQLHIGLASLASENITGDPDVCVWPLIQAQVPSMFKEIRLNNSDRSLGIISLHVSWSYQTPLMVRIWVNSKAVHGRWCLFYETFPYSS